MSKWKEYNLDEVYDFASGLSKGASEFGFGHGFLGFTDIFKNFFVPNELTSLVNSTEKEQQSCSIKRGDVFLTRTSETDEDLGMSCVALKDYPKATFNGFTKRLRPKGNVEILPEYAGFYFRSPKFRATVSGMSSITTRASLNNSMLAQLTISVPSIDEQKAIADTLFSLHQKIELLNRQNQTLAEISKTLFKNLFIQEVSETWEIKPLEDVCIKIASGGTPLTKVKEYYNGQINWYSTKELNDNFLYESNSKITELGINNSSAKLFPENTVIIAIYAAPTVGRLGILLNNGAFNQAACGLIANEKEISFEYLYLHLLTSRQILNDMACGSAQQNLSVGLIKEFTIPVPDFEVMKDFTTIIRPIFEKGKCNTRQIVTLEKQKSNLLNKLMTKEATIEI
ncbi:restriction endonuclease subunit S [Pedobacter sp. UBA4863]|uniref:restriction endonuclease subunit S n=1 Tax=Pedobacter sp. UBA4863 TaxID=1947060 RepID=UPI0025F5978E|nr:restriction endonuclease subunit S [Pedobacter sp. UBA4863]